MKAFAWGARLGLMLLIAALPPEAATKANNRVAVVIGKEAPELERYAAGQLCNYLEKLFGIQTQPTTTIPATAQALFLVGSPRTNELVKRATAVQPFPRLSEQGLLLRPTQFQKHPSLMVAGGSPRATLWAVYELVERWGVRYLLHGDVLPEKAGEFRLPDLNLVMEPKLTIRQWRVLNEHAWGPTSWGMADYGRVVDQLAKLKFNRILVNTWPSQPVLHLEVRGIKRRSGGMFFGQHYPLTDDMVGRELFGDAQEFSNPDLPVRASYEELSTAGERLLHNMMAYAHQRGLQVAITAHATEFPIEFAPLLRGGQNVIGWWKPPLTIAPPPDMPPDDPVLTALASAVLRATVNTYPEADYIVLHMPEHRQWTGLYEQAWKALDAKYGIERIRPLADALAAAPRRKDATRLERAVPGLKGDIVLLYFYDRLLHDLKVLKDTRRPDVKFIYSQVSEELFPILRRILPRGWEAQNSIDYTPARIVKRQEVMKDMPSREVPSTLIFTLHDDNTGPVPQLETTPLSQLTAALMRYGWAGFSTRYWLIGDHDPCVAYLARAAWDATATPESVDRDLMRAVCGEGCADDMLSVFSEVEAATNTLEWKDIRLAFPIPGMIMKQWKASPMEPHLDDVRKNYKRAMEAARRAQAKARPQGRSYVDYWAGRLEFGIAYIDTIAAVRRAAIAEADKKPAEALQQAETALAHARRALEAYARIAQDQSDRGAIAVTNEYLYRPLKAKVAEMKR